MKDPRLTTLLLVVISTLFGTPGIISAEELKTHIIDVGAGHCSITVIPDSQASGSSFDDTHFVMIYDTGKWSACKNAINGIVDPKITEIDLLIVSHSDFDHYGGMDEIVNEFQISEIWHTGFERTIVSWDSFTNALTKAANNGAIIRSLKDNPIIQGNKKRIGDAWLIEVFGKSEWSNAKPITKNNERRNALSIVVQLAYANRTILMTGDTVGRRLDDPYGACKDAELLMVKNNSSVPLKSDVIIAPHHGANNGSSLCFIHEVDPEYVIFPSGHNHQHPTRAVYDRYRAIGVEKKKIFRTDFGDNEGKNFEWTEGPKCKDSKGDDDITITINSIGQVAVQYRDDGVNTCER